MTKPEATARLNEILLLPEEEWNSKAVQDDLHEIGGTLLIEFESLVINIVDLNKPQP